MFVYANISLAHNRSILNSKAPNEFPWASREGTSFDYAVDFVNILVVLCIKDGKTFLIDHRIRSDFFFQK